VDCAVDDLLDDNIEMLLEEEKTARKRKVD
jgi:hypothetical protein